MKRGAQLLVLLLTLVAGGWAQRAETPARVWEGKLVIPTYELGPADPNPAFTEWRGGRPIYPYTALDTITNHRIDKTYNAVYLENEYLKVTVLPEMGGKLYSIYDKTAKREVLYTNHVVKYGIVAIRGAWTSGGIEWNFPDGHTVTTVSPVDYTTRMEPDGSAVVFVGDTERIQRMQWQVAIRLRPGRKVVETEATLNNRRETPGRYWFWATAAAHAAGDMRFIYPMREAYPHAFWPVFSFPNYNGVDLSLYREVPNALSLFARNSYRDFFGVYYEKSDWGIAHVADHREVPGKKTWTWGTDDAGSIWADKLTDADGQYVEFQAGRYETQMEHQFIAPHRVERFTEYWFPLDQMRGGFDEVNKDIALHVTRMPPASHEAFTINAAQAFNDVKIVVEDSKGWRWLIEHVNLDPAKPADFGRADGALLQPPLTFTITAQDGRELLRYRTDTPADGNHEFTPAARPVPDADVKSAEQAYVRGLAADRKSNERAARAAYEEALRRDANFAPARVALGLSFYRTREYERAAGHLEEALRRNPDSGDAHYYLALVRRAQGKTQETREHLTWCVREGQHEQVARYVAGEMAVAAGKPRDAIAELEQAIALDPRDIKARTMLALAYRVLALSPPSNGDPSEQGIFGSDLRAARDHAARLLDETLKQAPLDYLVLSERALLDGMRGLQASKTRPELERVLSREPDSVLELAFDYEAAGRPQDASSVLKNAVERAGAKAYPVWHYALGSLYLADRQRDLALAEFKLGASGSPEFVFPHRVEEIRLLETAVRETPKDARANYYLGNALAAHGRFEEARKYWQVAAELEPSNAIAHRNVAHALADAGKRDEALEAFNRAVKAAPGDFHLYVERDRLLAGMNRTKERIELLERAPGGVKPLVAQSLADAYVRAARYQDAIALLEKTAITSGEGESGGLSIYHRAQLGLARACQKEGKHAEAAAAFVEATEYPRNFGVGRPGHASYAREYLEAAGELEKAGKREEAQKWVRRAAEDPVSSPAEPNQPWSENYYYKAVALQRIGRNGESRALFQRLAALSDSQKMLEAEPSAPREPIRWLLAGLGLKELGQRDAARNALKRALQLDPGNDLARSALGELEARSR